MAEDDFDPDAFLGKEENKEPIDFGGVELQKQIDQSNPEPEKSQVNSFDPDAFLAEKPKADFDPDAFLGSYSTPSQKALTAVEQGAQGFAGPLATAAELGVSKLADYAPPGMLPKTTAKDISGRQEANPEIAAISQAAGLATGLATGAGEAGLATKAANAVAPKAFNAIGQRILANGIASGAIQGGNEISKALLGQADPHEAAVNISALGALGLLTGALGEGAAKIVPPAAKVLNKNLYKIFDLITDPSSVGFKAGALAGVAEGQDYKDKVEKALLRGTQGYVGGKALSALSKYGAPMILKAGATAENILSPEAINSFMTYGDKLSNGENLISNSINNLFKTAAPVAADKISGDEKERAKLDKIVSDGGAVQQAIDEHEPSLPIGYAHGGEVEHKEGEPNHLAQHFPEQAMLVNAAKARITNYLNMQRPQENMPKLAFDPQPDQTAQKKSYQRALDLAIKPTSILDHVKRGTLQPEDMRHFNSMYPELSDHLQKNLTQQITEQQLAGKKPPYALRQSLGIFMGVPLSSEMAPGNIMAAQATFAMQPKDPQQQAPQKNKKNTSTLSKTANQFLTGDQARAKGEQKLS